MRLTSTIIGSAGTDSGSTALWMSRHNCGCPIFALTPEVSSQRKMSLYRNVQPLYLEQSADRESVLREAENLLLAKGQVERGDLIVEDAVDERASIWRSGLISPKPCAPFFTACVSAWC